VSVFEYARSTYLLRVLISKALIVRSNDRMMILDLVDSGVGTALRGLNISIELMILFAIVALSFTSAPKELITAVTSSPSLKRVSLAF
jgi:hypothetical protein